MGEKLAMAVSCIAALYDGNSSQDVRREADAWLQRMTLTTGAWCVDPQSSHTLRGFSIFFMHAGVCAPSPKLPSNHFPPKMFPTTYIRSRVTGWSRTDS